MPGPAIINIVNFIRAIEPRMPELDLLKPVVEQMRLVKEHDLSATWLIQYDAMLEQRFLDVLRPNLDDKQEVGIWFEVVQPLVERAGLTWHGRYPWDWHTDVGFSIAYTPAERERLADIFIEEFVAAFGFQPRSMGSWLFDAHLLGYLYDKYGIVAACNCKDQWGTDGYSMWGGYYSQAYYPSRTNAFMPAQHADAQIPVPVFRMLGSDPIYQFSDTVINDCQGVVTLEPVYTSGGGGGDPKWVRWFFDVNSFSPSLAFSYAQAGQENAFGWPAMANGIIDQFAYIAELQRQGRARVETMAESGAWFKSEFPVTPATAVTALTDWRGEGHRAIWYDSRYYRTSLLWEEDRCYIRDLRVFDETYAERYLTETCKTSNCTYDTLPVVDGLLWSDASTRAGMHFVALDAEGNPMPMTGGAPIVREDGDTLHISWPVNGGTVEFTLAPDVLRISADVASWGLLYQWGETPRMFPAMDVTPDGITFNYEGQSYRLACTQGTVEASGESWLFLQPGNGQLELKPLAQQAISMA